MDEEITVINSNTRNEKIKNFFINNKKKIIILLTLLIVILISFFAYGELKKKKIIRFQIYIMLRLWNILKKTQYKQLRS